MKLSLPRWYYIVGILVLVVGGAYLFGGAGKSLGATLTVATSDFKEQVSVSGTVIAARNVEKGNGDKPYYTAKILTAKFYASSLLPMVYGKILAIRKNDRSLLQMTDALFGHA